MPADNNYIFFPSKGWPGCHPQSWDGTLRILKTGELCEAEAEARGSCFHLIVGQHAYGDFLCIPNWNVGTGIAGMDDIFWNTERPQNYTALKKADACPVAAALCQIAGCTNRTYHETAAGGRKEDKYNG